MKTIHPTTVFCIYWAPFAMFCKGWMNEYLFWYCRTLVSTLTHMLCWFLWSFFVVVCCWQKILGKVWFLKTCLFKHIIYLLLRIQYVLNKDEFSSSRSNKRNNPWQMGKDNNFRKNWDSEMCDLANFEKIIYIVNHKMSHYLSLWNKEDSWTGLLNTESLVSSLKAL